MKRVIEFRINDEYSGKTVAEVLKERFRMSGTLIKELKRYEDGMTLNGSHIRTVDTVKTGDLLCAAIYDRDPGTVVPREMDIDIVYEDMDILVVNKASGMPTHPSRGHFEDTLANGVAAHYIKNGEEHVFRAVNRLDKDTSGLMCIAKNSYAHARLGEEIKDGSLKRKYMAIVMGVIDTDGTVDAPIERESFIKRKVGPSGKKAVTHYVPIVQKRGCTLIELSLETGRTHQIRVHMAHIGHPLLGDWLYGEEDRELFQRQALHSSFLSLIHPVTGEKLCFKAGLPSDMKDFLSKDDQLSKSGIEYFTGI